jgi:hypothetical protein
MSFLRHLCGLAVLCLGSGTVPFSAQPLYKHPFPMSPGTYWIYRGTMRWTHDLNQVSESKLAWRTEIRRFIQRGTVSAVVVSGFPSDINWSNGHPNASDSLFVEANGKFYFIPGDRFEDALNRLERASGTVDGLLNDDDLILKWPLSRGEKYCDRDSMARPDSRYCWFVASVARTVLPAVAGAGSAEHTEYLLDYNTNPDDASFSFVPGIGITKYSYHHHGTVADTELQLVEFHPAASNHQ